MIVNMYYHMAKVVIKILQGSAVTQTVLGGLTRLYILWLQISYSVYVYRPMPKNMKIDRQ